MILFVVACRVISLTDILMAQVAHIELSRCHLLAQAPILCHFPSLHPHSEATQYIYFTR